MRARSIVVAVVREKGGALIREHAQTISLADIVEQVGSESRAPCLAISMTAMFQPTMVVNRE